MSMFLSPGGFLKYGGIVLLVVGIVGYTGVTNSIEFFQLDAGENAVHVVLGIVAIALGFGVKGMEDAKKWIVVAVGALALVATIYSLITPSGAFAAGTGFTSPNAGFTNLENPADTILHLVVTVWAAAAAFMKAEAPAMRPA